MWPSRSGAMPDALNLRRTSDTHACAGRVSRFHQMNIRPQYGEWRTAPSAQPAARPPQTADANDVNAARSMSSVSSVVPTCTLIRTLVERTVAVTPWL